MFLDQCIFTKEIFQEKFGYDTTKVIGYIEKDGKPGFTSTSEGVNIGDILQIGTVVTAPGCTNW